MKIYTLKEFHIAFNNGNIHRGVFANAIAFRNIQREYLCAECVVKHKEDIEESILKASFDSNRIVEVVKENEITGNTLCIHCDYHIGN